MDLSSKRSDEEDRVMQRQLYRPGQNQNQNQPAGSTSSKSSAPPKPKRSSSSSSSSGGLTITPSQRKKMLIALAVVVWLFFLGGVSYCLFLPDLDALNRERMAVFTDKNLSPEERREKLTELREKEKNLTPTQRKQMWEMTRKEMTRKGNKNTFDFMQLTEEQQIAQLKKEAEERQKRFEEMRKMWGDKGKGNRGNGNGGKGGGGPGGGPGGGWGGGPGGGGGGAADSSRDRPEALGQRLDSQSPEARAGGAYKMRLMQQQGLGFGGRGGGPGGGKGGPGR